MPSTGPARQLLRSVSFLEITEIQYSVLRTSDRWPVLGIKTGQTTRFMACPASQQMFQISFLFFASLRLDLPQRPNQLDMAKPYKAAFIKYRSIGDGRIRVCLGTRLACDWRQIIKYRLGASHGDVSCVSIDRQLIVETVLSNSRISYVRDNVNLGDRCLRCEVKTGSWHSRLSRYL